jgi:hypothetical protein
MRLHWGVYCPALNLYIAVTLYLSIKLPTAKELNKVAQPMSATFAKDQGRRYVPDRPKKLKIENPHAMTDKEILELSKKIGKYLFPIQYSAI